MINERTPKLISLSKKKKKKLEDKRKGKKIIEEFDPRKWILVSKPKG